MCVGKHIHSSIIILKTNCIEVDRSGLWKRNAKYKRVKQFWIIYLADYKNIIIHNIEEDIGDSKELKEDCGLCGMCIIVIDQKEICPISLFDFLYLFIFYGFWFQFAFCWLVWNWNDELFNFLSLWSFAISTYLIYYIF